jgi:hypothetical protein
MVCTMRVCVGYKDFFPKTLKSLRRTPMRCTARESYVYWDSLIGVYLMAVHLP